MIFGFLKNGWFRRPSTAAGAAQELALHARDESNQWLTHGVHLIKTGELSAAARAFRESLAADADNAVALSNLASITMDDDPRAALGHLLKAEALAPRDANIQINLGGLMMTLGRLGEARRHYLRALEFDPANLAVRSNLATLDLAEGRYSAASWDAFRARWKHESFSKHCVLPGLRYLDDEVLPRERVLVHLEQGLGDEICFAGCVDELRAHAAAVAMTCEPRLRTLFTTALPAVTVIAREGDWEARARAFAPQSQVYAGDLPYWLRRGSGSFPVRGAYLRADAARAAHWRARLRALGGGLKIGISWRGGLQHTGRHSRSIPLWDWAPLLGLPGVQWIDLQYGEHRAELRAAQNAGVPITRFDEAIADYDETAALVSELDLVISVATAVVDLAGALGKPCWVLVPRLAMWKFGVDGPSTPWYPSLRLFRKSGDETWGRVMGRVAARLQGAGLLAPPQAEALAEDCA